MSGQDRNTEAAEEKEGFTNGGGCRGGERKGKEEVSKIADGIYCCNAYRVAGGEPKEGPITATRIG